MTPLTTLPERLGEFFRLLVTRTREDNLPQHAAALTYTSLLSLVPLMTVGLAVFAAFPVAEQVGERFQDFVFQNFVPAVGEVIKQHLVGFSANAARITGAGALFLVVTALLLIRTIELAFNDIWRAHGVRNPLSRFVVYWAVLTLGPVFMGASVAATSYLASLPLFADAAAQIQSGRALVRLAPLFASTLAFTLLYLVVPVRRVRVTHALAGGLLAALLFEVAKRGFVAYVTHFPTHTAIYGALAAVPLFLVWLYLSWMVTLIGAEFANVLGLYRRGGGGKSDRPADLIAALQVIGLLREAQRRGLGVDVARLVQSSGLADAGLAVLLQHLQRLDLIAETADGSWMLSRDLDDLTLWQLIEGTGLPASAPGEVKRAAEVGNGEAGRILGAAQDAAASAADVPLSHLFDTPIAASDRSGTAPVRSAATAERQP